MSQPGSDFEFDSPDFSVTGESSYETAQSALQQEPAIRYRKQGFSIYTVMLILSFVCLLATLIILFIEAGKYT